MVAGAKGHIKRTGTINGQGRYQFKITATDGQAKGGDGVDKFGMKIWYEDPTSYYLVHDKQVSGSILADPTTIIGGGSIVIHP